MAPFSIMTDENTTDSLKSDKRDFSSIIDFIGVSDHSKIKKRRRGDAEKKRRDRINKCLDQLEELIPYVKQKKLCSKVDKAEVLELTVKYIKETLFHRDHAYSHSNLTMFSAYDYKNWTDTRKIPTMRWPNHLNSLSEHHSKSELCRCGCGRVGDILSKQISHEKNESQSRILLPHRSLSSQSSSLYSLNSPTPDRSSPESMEIASSPSSVTSRRTSPITHKIDYLLKDYEKREY